MDGHYLTGLSDYDGKAEIELCNNVLGEADAYLGGAENSLLLAKVRRVTELIQGFETPYGMELLASVHWAAVHEGELTLEKVSAAVHDRSERKRQIMQQAHIDAAWVCLRDKGWLKAEINSEPRQLQLCL